MYYLILFLTLAAGIAAGALIVRTLLLKRQQSVLQELEALRLKNVETQTALNSSMKQKNSSSRTLLNAKKRF